jgi:cyclopropane-fatty-acyl-phospholipid synthase
VNLLEKKVSSYLKKADIILGGDRAWDIRVHDKSVYLDTMLKGTLGFGDGYSSGKWDCDQLDTFFEKILLSRHTKRSKIRSVAGYAYQLRNKLLNTQTGKKAFQVAEQHYDLGNDMYALMLGPSMGYSCGLYLKESDDLTLAQYQKFDALCQKLLLKKGMRILEIGCGWGTFAKFATEKYGVDVVGITVSKEQKAYAEEINKETSAIFKLIDYQKLDAEYDGAFDRVVSIEMIEAVGKKNFRTYFETINRALKPDGLAGIQAIVGTGGVDPFLSTRIFPNGLVPSQQDIVDNITGILRLKSWTSFGRDYDKTLLDWHKNFVTNWPKIKKLKNKNNELIYGENFYRMWRYYLLCCAATFRVGINDDAQIVLSKISTDSPLK